MSLTTVNKYSMDYIYNPRLFIHGKLLAVFFRK